ncbi:MAG TPA: bifunctional GTP diphosphokinase/guanosine-3',5'-bis pyrophosphate 3'-pyrophosphohydrolase [Gammaproteobacteria bacterium]|nr:bifunctional GTP diphosphokinase/guanosine-3',5'-bis pyrophosphate 3'-pyrophosphohydrolase [Gammaproteobacteria bacterium]
MAVIPEQIATHDGEPRLLISDLCRQLDSYLEADQIREVYRAYLFSAEAHEGQQRVSGEPYIYHPLSVAQILADMRMDYKSIIAAILHDVIEDTGTAKEQVAKSFGEEVAELVDGVSKLTQITFESQAEAQAENFRKMMLAMVRDIRVILIKLADRLHNMRTLGVMPPAKRRRIARETLDIYAPIANRLGMNSMRLELEDLGFAAYYPLRARTLAEAVKRARGNRKEILTKIESALKQRLEHDGVPGRVHSREKHLLSLYQKMRAKRLSFNDVLDVYAFRVVVENVDTCYRVLGVVHSLYKPVPGRFKDYIAIPKANGYQSLHTVLFGPYGVPIEVQIRTDDMDRVAESGIAAHWLYKSASGGAHERAREWLRELLEMQKHAGNSLEFLENVKIDLFPDEVYVFTPRGKIMELPRGATAVDFAYAVHTDVGNTCIAAKIDRRLAPLRTPLHNGQTVEIITAPGAHPNPSWLNFAVTGKARSNIRHYLKNLHRDEAVNLGRRLLDKALLSLGMPPTELSLARMGEIATSYGMKTADDLLEDIGLGNRMPMLAARRLLGNEEAGEIASDAGAPLGSTSLIIKGTEGMVVNFAKCCRPIPGDRIVGFVSAGRGIVIHAENCKNIADFRNRPDKWVDVEWEREVKGEFSAELRVEVANQRGVLATVAAAIADMGSNIENVAIEERDGLNTSIAFTVTVHDRKHLARVMRRIRHIPLVLRISRAKS